MTAEEVRRLREVFAAAALPSRITQTGSLSPRSAELLMNDVDNLIVELASRDGTTPERRGG